MNLYALDGVCHNAEPGTYGHECGKPAKWLGTGSSGMVSGFCDDCKANGYEAKGKTDWRPAGNPWRVEQWWGPLQAWIGWRVVRDRPDMGPAPLEIADGGEFATDAGPVSGWRHRAAAQRLAVDLNRKEMT